MKLTLLDYLDSRLGPHVGRAPEIQFFCPFCPDRRGSESSQPRFRFNTAKKKGMCFRCGYAAKTLSALFKDLNGGKILLEEQSFLKEDEETAFQENVYSKVLVTLFGSERSDRELIPVPLPAEYEPLWEDVSPMGKIGRNYLLRERRIRKEHLKKFEIGYCASGDYEGRVIFPVTLALARFISPIVTRAIIISRRRTPRTEKDSSRAMTSCTVTISVGGRNRYCWWRVQSRCFALWIIIHPSHCWGSG